MMNTTADAVTCEFVRQRCTHEALFQPFYKRSNRTKGSKILRCFPHCCPHHAHRGFCGSSLHVRVQWGAPRPPPPLHVLGRFRLTDTPPLPVGHRLVAASVFAAVQSDDAPNGEWIVAQIIYSWSETNWLFEINNAARWFYGWESSTVKSQRLKDHVLDVYVLAGEPLGGGGGGDTLRVVASTSSPSFQLISFRRATDDAMLALSATHHMRQQLHQGGGAVTPAEEQEEERHEEIKMAAPQLRLPPSSSSTSSSATRPLPSLRAANHHAPHWSAPPLVHRPLPSSTSQPAPAAGPQVGWRRDRHASTAPLRAPSAVPSAPPTNNVWEITNLLGQLHQIPLGDAMERLAWMHETYEHYVTVYQNGADKKGPVLLPSSLPSPAPSSPAVQFERAVRHALATAERTSSSPPLPRKVPSRLLATLTELAMWLLLDRQTATELSGSLLKAEAALLSPPLLRRHFGRMMFWLHDHVNRFLHVRFNRSVRDLLLECQDLGFQIQFEAPSSPSSSSSTPPPHPPPFLSPPLPKTKGIDVFVAQLREIRVAVGAKRKREAVPSGRPLLPPPPSAHTALRRLFNAQWRCATDRVSLRCAAPPPLPHGGSPPLSLLSLVWFWRQFSVMTFTFPEDELRLEVASLFASPPLRSALLLDGRHRFLRAFPAGESTLATCVGRYTFGDYVATYAPAVGELQLTFYAFLSPSQLPSPSSSSADTLESVAADACYCYHVRLVVAPGGATMVASVAVTRGELDVPALRQVGYGSPRQLLSEMATWSLPQKLSAVRGFHDAGHGELVYVRG